jgi:predicted enzyme related to lactoylglutathione lyase
MASKFFWYDLMTPDTKAAAKFYSDVVGWGTQAAGPPGTNHDYSLFTVNGQGHLGLMEIPDDAKKVGMPPCWTGYVATDDVDKDAKRLEQNGGKVHKPPQDVPGIIRFAVVADPQGAVFILAKGLIHDKIPEVPMDTPGTVGWHELYAADGATAFPFYEKMFGWTKSDAFDMGPGMGQYQLFKTGGEYAMGGIMTKPPQMPAPPHWCFYFNVTGIDAAKVRVEKSGGKVLHGPMEVPGGQWIIQCVDPQGAHFNLVAPKR